MKFQVRFINGNDILLARDSIWPRIFDPECNYFDEVEHDEDGIESVCSIGSAASKSSSKSNKSSMVESSQPKKKRYYL